MQRWQHRFEPVQKRLFGGCHLTRPIVELVRGAGFEVTEVDHYYEKGTPKIFGWHVARRGAVALGDTGDLGANLRAAGGRALDLEVPVERLEAVGQAAQPEPSVGSAPPTPSSATVTVARPLVRRTLTLACEAFAYFATFVIASATT